MTSANVALYVKLVADYRLNRELAGPGAAFLDGLQALIDQQWLQMFNDRELQQLISGASKGLDVKDLRAHTELGGGYHAEHPIVAWLWHVLESFDAAQQAAFLKFVTGCSRCVLSPWHCRAEHGRFASLTANGANCSSPSVREVTL